MFKKVTKSTGFVVVKHENGSKWYWGRGEEWVFAMSYARVFVTKETAETFAAKLGGTVEVK